MDTTTKALRVMLVDEDTVSLKLMAYYIKGYVKSSRVTTYSDASDSLNMLKSSPENHPDILILSLYMTEINGLSFIHQLNEYYQKTYGSRPPYRIVLLAGLLENEQIDTEHQTFYEHPDIIHFLEPAGISKQDIVLPIDACVSKPVNKEKLDIILNLDWSRTRIVY